MTGGSSPYDCCVGCGPQCFGANCTGADDKCYPNEFTINKFCPPYVSSAIPQPRVAAAPATIGYGVPFALSLTIRANLRVPAVRAAIVNPGFGESATGTSALDVGGLRMTSSNDTEDEAIKKISG